MPDATPSSVSSSLTLVTGLDDDEASHTPLGAPSSARNSLGGTGMQILHSGDGVNLPSAHKNLSSRSPPTDDEPLVRMPSGNRSDGKSFRQVESTIGVSAMSAIDGTISYRGGVDEGRRQTPRFDEAEGAVDDLFHAPPQRGTTRRSAGGGAGSTGSSSSTSLEVTEILEGSTKNSSRLGTGDDFEEQPPDGDDSDTKR